MTAELRKALAAGGTRRPGRRFPAQARSVIATYATDQFKGGRSAGDVARELGLAEATLRKWTAGPAAAFVSVQVVPTTPERIVVRGPAGLVVEGLDLAGVAQLLRLLS